MSTTPHVPGGHSQKAPKGYPSGQASSERKGVTESGSRRGRERAAASSASRKPSRLIPIARAGPYRRGKARPMGREEPPEERAPRFRALSSLLPRLERTGQPPRHCVVIRPTLPGVLSRNGSANRACPPVSHADDRTTGRPPLSFLLQPCQGKMTTAQEQLRTSSGAERVLLGRERVLLGRRYGA